MAVGIWAWVEVLRDGLGDGLDFSVTVVAALWFGCDRGLVWAVVVRRSEFVVVVEGVTVLPGVVTSEVVVVVVVVSVWPSRWRRT